MGIPIVSEKYLLARLKAGKEIDHELYLMTVVVHPRPHIDMFVLHCFLYTYLPQWWLTLLTKKPAVKVAVLPRSCSPRKLRGDSAMSRSRLALTGTRPAMIKTL